MEAEKLLKINDALDAERGTLKNVFQDIRDYVMPNKDSVTQRSDTPGNRADVLKRYDSAGVEANEVLAANMQGTLTPTESPWIRYELRDLALNEDASVRAWLDECTQLVHADWRASNFDNQINEAYLDLGGYGTTCVFQEELPRDVNGRYTGLQFETWPIAEYNFTTDGRGVANGLYRTMKLTAAEADELLSEKPGFKGFSDELRSILENNDTPEKRHTQKFDIVHAIFDTAVHSHPGVPDDKPIASIYVERKAKQIVCEGGFNEFPAAVGRWKKTAEDNHYGRSPSWVALPEIKGLSSMVKLLLKALAKDIAPPLFIPSKSMVGGIRTTPNALNYYDARRTGGQKPDYLTAGTQWAQAFEYLSRWEDKIRRIYMTDQFDVLRDKDMTLGEFMERVRMMRRLLGPTFGRLTSELFTPLAVRSFAIRLRAGAFPEPPGVLVDAAAQGYDIELDVTYTGPMARAQRQEEAAGIMNTYEAAAGISGAKGGDPAVFDNLDDDIAIQELAEINGTPAKMLRGREAIEAQRQARAQAQQQAVELEQAQVTADTADKAASAAQRSAG